MVKMDQEAVVNNILEHLQRIQATPKMYFGADDKPDLALAHLYGLHEVARSLLNFKGSSVELRDEAAKRRGWWYHADGYIPALQRKGMNDPEIVTELIAFEIEFWKIYSERLSN